MARRFSKSNARYMDALSSRYGLPGAGFPAFVSFWFKVSSASGTTELLCFNDNSDAQWRRFYLSGTTCYLSHKGYDNPTPVILTLGTITLNTWHHIWGYFGSGTDFRGQLDNNTEQTYAGFTGTFNSYTQLNVGNRASGQAGMDGDIAEIGIWDRNLDSILKTALQNGIPPWIISEEDLLGYYPMWGAYDISGTGSIEQNCKGDPTEYLQSSTTDFIPQSEHSPTIPAFTWFSGIPLTTESSQIVSPSGIASLESFGTLAINQSIKPNGIPTAEAFGVHSINLTINVNAYGIISEEAFGEIAISKEQEIVTEGIPSEEAIGDSFVSRGAVGITTFSIFSEEAFGTAIIVPALLDIEPLGISSAEAFGIANLTKLVKPIGIASVEVFGNHSILPGSINVAPSGIISEEEFGTASLSTGNVYITPTGIVSSETFSNAVLSTGNTNVAPIGINSLETFGTITVLEGTVNISFTGIPSGEAFGAMSVLPNTALITPAGIPGAEAFGNFTTKGGPVNIDTVGIPSDEAFGTIAVIPGNINIVPQNITSQEAFGAPLIGKGAVNVTTTGISSSEAFGALQISVTIHTVGIASEETFGDTALSTGTVNLNVTGIPSEEIIGSPVIRNVLILLVPSIDSQEAFGLLNIGNHVKNSFMALMDEDLDAIMDEEDEFSIGAVYQHKNGLTISNLPVIFDNEFIEVSTDAQSPIISRQPMIGCKDRFKVRPTRGDKVIIQGVNYSVLTYEPDGTGWAVLTLQHERTNR